MGVRDFLHGWTLSRKIVASFTVLVITFLGFAIYANHFGANLNETSKNIFRWANTRDAASNALDNANAAQDNAVLLLLASNQQEYDRYEGKFNSYVTIVNKLLDDYKTVAQNTDYPTETEKQAALNMIQEEQGLWQTYVTQQQRVFQAVRNGDRATADNLMKNEVRASFVYFAIALQKDAGESMQRAEQDAKSGEVRYTRAVRTSIVVTILVLLITTGCAVFLYKTITGNVQRILQNMAKVAAGDFRLTMDESAGDEFAEMGAAFNLMLDRVRKMIKSIQRTSGSVSESSQALSTTAERSAQDTQNVVQSINEVAGAAHRQMSALSQTAQNVESFTNGIEKTNGLVSHVASEISTTVARANEGSRLVKDTVGEMNAIADTVKDSSDAVAKLGERSKEIGTILEVITGISSQTNLLALNAAIEASRAGEAGKGFAVVAEEVRKLAEESQDAAQKISGLITAIQAETNDAVTAMNTGRDRVEKGRGKVAATGEGFAEILKMILHVQDNASAMEKTMQELTEGARKISEVTRQIRDEASKVASESERVSSSTERQAADMQQIAASSRNLSDLAHELDGAAAKFKTT